MAVKSDIEIAQAANVKPIQEIAARLDIPSESLIPYGHDKAKITADFIKSKKGGATGKLILVTAVSPTPAGEGKTTTTVNLGASLAEMGLRTLIIDLDPQGTASTGVGIENRGLDVVQPDLHYYGGYIRSARVARMAHAKAFRGSCSASAARWPNFPVPGLCGWSPRYIPPSSGAYPIWY